MEKSPYRFEVRHWLLCIMQWSGHWGWGTKPGKPGPSRRLNVNGSCLHRNVNLNVPKLPLAQITSPWEKIIYSPTGWLTPEAVNISIENNFPYIWWLILFTCSGQAHLINFLIHLFSKYLLSKCFALGTVVGIRDLCFLFLVWHGQTSVNVPDNIIR